MAQINADTDIKGFSIVMPLVLLMQGDGVLAKAQAKAMEDKLQADVLVKKGEDEEAEIVEKNLEQRKKTLLKGLEGSG